MKSCTAPFYGLLKNFITSAFLYGTVYDIHVFIHHHKWQFMSSMFFLWRSTRDGCLRKKAHVNFSFENCCSLQRPQIHHIADKNGFIDSKNPVSISSLNQGNHNTGHLWIQTDHNLNRKCPDYGQPVTINMYDQTMISLEPCSIYYCRVWSVCFCMGGQPVFNVKNLVTLMKL